MKYNSYNPSLQFVIVDLSLQSLHYTVCVGEPGGVQSWRPSCHLP